jgi:hypothetical protein
VKVHARIGRHRFDRSMSTLGAGELAAGDDHGNPQHAPIADCDANTQEAECPVVQRLAAQPFSSSRGTGLTRPGRLGLCNC